MGKSHLAMGTPTRIVMLTRMSMAAPLLKSDG
jgi:hypothetical protein